MIFNDDGSFLEAVFGSADWQIRIFFVLTEIELSFLETVVSDYWVTFNKGTEVDGEFYIYKQCPSYPMLLDDFSFKKECYLERKREKLVLY